MIDKDRSFIKADRKMKENKKTRGKQDEKIY